MKTAIFADASIEWDWELTYLQFVAMTILLMTLPTASRDPFEGIV